MPTIATEIVLPGRVTPDGLQVRTRTLPGPAVGRVLMRMDATGVSFAEQQMRRGKYYDQPAFPFVPGYDLVGTAVEVGSDVDPAILGRRFAAVTKVGSWASHLDVEAADLVAVPESLDPVAAETLIVNGVTAWQMLYRTAHARSGATVVVLGANGGVGSALVQLAQHAGMTVIGTASPRHHERLRSLGATPVDYHATDMYEQIRAVAPEGVDAVFDHVGGTGVASSWRLVRRGGALVSYGTAGTKNSEGNSKLPVLKLVAQLLAWNCLPNGRSAHFFNFWAGKARRPDEFRARLAEDLTQVLDLLAKDVLVAQVAATFSLTDAAAALELAESRTVAGKVVIVP